MTIPEPLRTVLVQLGERLPANVPLNSDEAAADLRNLIDEASEIDPPEPEPEPNVYVVRFDPFVPSPSEPNRRYAFDVPPAVNDHLERVELSMEVVVGNWSDDPAGLHSLFWFQRGDRWRNGLLAYANLRGPARNKLLLSTQLGWGDKKDAATAPDVVTQQGSRLPLLMVWRDGQMTLAVDGNHPLGLRVEQGQAPIPDTNAYFVELGFWHAGAHGPERPTYGWEYRNLAVRFYAQAQG